MLAESEMKMSERERISVSPAASAVIRAVAGKIIESGMKSMPEEFRDLASRIDAKNPSDPSAVAIILMIAGCEKIGIDLGPIPGLKIAPKNGGEGDVQP